MNEKIVKIILKFQEAYSIICILGFTLLLADFIGDKINGDKWTIIVIMCFTYGGMMNYLEKNKTIVQEVKENVK